MDTLARGVAAVAVAATVAAAVAAAVPLVPASAALRRRALRRSAAATSTGGEVLLRPLLVTGRRLWGTRRSSLRLLPASGTPRIVRVLQVPWVLRVVVHRVYGRVSDGDGVGVEEDGRGWVMQDGCFRDGARHLAFHVRGVVFEGTVVLEALGG